MKTSHRIIDQYIFKPFELKLMIENQEEYEDLFYFFSFYNTLPLNTLSSEDRKNKLIMLLKQIHDELHIKSL